jgi:phage tail-like protein
VVSQVYPPDPLLRHKFWVEIDGIAQAFFQECSGLEVSTSVEAYEEGGQNSYTHQFPTRSTVGRVTLKKGLAEPDALWTWYLDVINGTIRRRSVTILLFENKVDGQSDAAVAWTLEDALPVRWVAPVFNADEAKPAVDQLEFICGGISRQRGQRGR